MLKTINLASFLVFLFAEVICVGSTSAEQIPVEIAAPSNQSLRLTLKAKGYQVYECRAVSGSPGTFEWILKEPDADLFDADHYKVGHHSGGPKWELTSGDVVKAHLHSKVQSPDAKSIPWLLLDVDEASGQTLGQIVSIQRVNTTGGLPPQKPAKAAQAGQIKRSKYTAIYNFYATTN